MVISVKHGLVITIFSALSWVSCVSAGTTTKGRSALAGSAATFNLALKPEAGTQKIKLVLKKLPGQHLCICFFAPGGELLERSFTDKSSGSVEKVFNFTDAEPGDYCIEVSDGIHKIKKIVSLQRNQPETTVSLVISG